MHMGVAYGDPSEVSFSKTINNLSNKKTRTSSNTWVSRRSGLDG